MEKLLLSSELPEGFLYTDENGLKESQVQERRERGLANVMSQEMDRSIGQILAKNVFTLFNFLNFALAACLLLVGIYRNMTFLVIVIANILIGTIQEYRAQKTIREAKKTARPDSRLMHELNRLIRFDSMVLVPLGILLFRMY